ncbi:23S rRNA pseudouridine2604 synthase [Paucimonas lemoignei]|uniref:Dual-specificity RNA pseudouridine synthase RluF n=1 Tax=Paucimonas lemoignei TaxID=29443 RepID=A0A4V2UII8_PAULE|nr:RNA pseudouridine synthase [Paucimonas lemoignei]TCS36360.1 23S rRNA pseudouridine2604 synthase [Paucimonas lemoignei]
MSTDTIRLSKLVAQQFSCSRTEAEHYIEGGWVKVGNEIIEEPGHRVSPLAQAELLPGAVCTPAEPVTILLHKPSGVAAEAVMRQVSEENRSADDRSGIRLLKRHLSKPSLSAPLEAMASGLLIASDDWRVIRKLTHDPLLIEHEVIADVSGELAADGLHQLNRGIVYKGKVLPPMKVSWQNETRLRFAVKGLQPGLIQHACAQVGLEVSALKRIRIGRISMAGLKPGEWRFLLPHERF